MYAYDDNDIKEQVISTAY